MVAELIGRPALSAQLRQCLRDRCQFLLGTDHLQDVGDLLAHRLRIDPVLLVARLPELTPPATGQISIHRGPVTTQPVRRHRDTQPRPTHHLDQHTPRRLRIEVALNGLELLCIARFSSLQAPRTAPGVLTRCCPLDAIRCMSFRRNFQICATRASQPASTGWKHTFRCLHRHTTSAPPSTRKRERRSNEPITDSNNVSA